MLNTHIRFNRDADEEYEPSDSDDEYDENEKALLNKVRTRESKYSDSEEEVYGLESDDDQSDIALSDVEGQDQDEDDLPNNRAWGKDKRKFYKTDYVDPDYGGYQGKDAFLAEIEEEEAKNLQKQLVQQMDDEDFMLEPLSNKKPEGKVEIEEIIKTDVSKLSKRQKMQLLQKESPEFFGLVEDFKVKISTVRDYLQPIINKQKNNTVKNCDAVKCVQTHYELILNYCTNICMYLLLKTSRINLQNHPIVKRLYQYKQLLLQLEPVFEQVIKPQIEMILKENETAAEVIPEKNRKTLKLLAELTKNVRGTKNLPENSESEEPPKKKQKKVKVDNETEEIKSDADFDEEINDVEVQDKNTIEAVDGKRAITYQMAKNKGLTPHRKKEQRNPRVKHRNKFRKAKIRRKGAVRDVRTEVSRYGGEMSGIKASVIKSIKIKS